MKKNTLKVGIAYLMIGLVFLLCGILLDTKLNSLFWGFSGAGIIPGFTMIYKYFYWIRPKYSTRYEEKLEEESINLNDERKEKFRNQSGRYTYILGLITICVSIVILSVLSMLDIVQNVKGLIIYLGLFAIFQYIAGILIYQFLNKKY